LLPLPLYSSGRVSVEFCWTWAFFLHDSPDCVPRFSPGPSSLGPPCCCGAVIFLGRLPPFSYFPNPVPYLSVKMFSSSRGTWRRQVTCSSCLSSSFCVVVRSYPSPMLLSRRRRVPCKGLHDPLCFSGLTTPSLVFPWTIPIPFLYSPNTAGCPLRSNIDSFSRQSYLRIFYSLFRLSLEPPTPVPTGNDRHPLPALFPIPQSRRPCHGRLEPVSPPL